MTKDKAMVILVMNLMSTHLPIGNCHMQDESLVGRHWHASNFIKVDIPEFHGRLLRNFLIDIVPLRSSDFKDIPETQRAKLVATRFCGYALA